jgi:hypothetical protein
MQGRQRAKQGFEERGPIVTRHPGRPRRLSPSLALVVGLAGLCGIAPGCDGGVTWTRPMRTTPGAHAPLTSASKLDIVFMVDDSRSMAPLQDKMRARLPDFMDVLRALPGGMPDVHIAVVSSSLGAGIYGDVPGCAPGAPGDDAGAFQRPPACAQLDAGAHFLSSTVDPQTGTRVENFTGTIDDAFGCMALLGDNGCGFEAPFKATEVALTRAQSNNDPANAGFLRPDAYLAVVMLTNEDDCSVTPDSTLFDPGQTMLSDPLGGLQSYRCNEFGHLCGGQSPPHTAPSSPLTLTDCVSDEDPRLDYDGDRPHLYRVNDFIDFLFALKPAHPEQIFVAAIAGPPTPYTVVGQELQLPSGATEVHPAIQHSCVQSTGEFADPGVRMVEWTRAFGPNAFFGSICQDDFTGTMTTIAHTMTGG